MENKTNTLPTPTSQTPFATQEWKDFIQVLRNKCGTSLAKELVTAIIASHNNPTAYSLPPEKEDALKELLARHQTAFDQCKFMCSQLSRLASIEEGGEKNLRTVLISTLISIILTPDAGTNDLDALLPSLNHAIINTPYPVKITPRSGGVTKMKLPVTHIAAMYKRWDIVGKLLDNGADLLVQNTLGLSLLDYAERQYQSNPTPFTLNIANKVRARIFLHQCQDSETIHENSLCQLTTSSSPNKYPSGASSYYSGRS